MFFNSLFKEIFFICSDTRDEVRLEGTLAFVAYHC